MGESDNDGEGEEEQEEDEEDAMGEDDMDHDMLQSSVNFQGSVQGGKRSRLGQSKGAHDTVDVTGLARGLVAARALVTPQDSEELIVETEKIVEQLTESPKPSDHLPPASRVAGKLEHLWARHGRLERDDAESNTNIGPSPEQPDIQRANFVASLFLNLHYPSSHQARQEQSFNGSLMDGQSMALSLASAYSGVPIPRVLLDWLDTYYDPSAGIIDETEDFAPYYSRCPLFWDAVHMCITRGRFEQALKFLRGANFGDSDGDDEGIEYTDRQLQNIDTVINEVVALIEECPALAVDDWDVKGEGWKVFRHDVSVAASRLRKFADGTNGEDAADMSKSIFRTSKNPASLSVSQASRRAESNVPFEISSSLIDLYSLLLGNPSDVLKSSISWLDGALSLAVWWSGEEDAASMSPLGRSLNRSQQSRVSDVTPALAYREHLSAAFDHAVSFGELNGTFDRTDHLQVGIACVIKDEMDGLLGILQSWSMTIATAVAELASAAGLLTESPAHGMGGFDQSDLMVLSFGQDGPKRSIKDEMLLKYADSLFSKSDPGKDVLHQGFAGWQLAINILSRLDDMETAEAKVSEMLERIPLDTNDQADRLLQTCDSMGFTKHARTIAERYADTITERTTRYGDALFYYARAHKPKKMKHVLDILTSLCLVQSAAYPPQAELDPRLKAFISDPKQTITQLATADMQAAEQISRYLSGYATLRRFYDLRDEDIYSPSGPKSVNRVMARKKTAAAALIAVINSAGDSIKGGLYDETVDVVIEVDCLLVLLGEALPLLKGKPRAFTPTHILSLLRAVEDLETVGPRITSQCEEVLISTLANAHGSSAPSPRSLLKSTSGLTNSTTFSLVGSSMLNSTAEGSEGSGVLVGGEVKRGWDWRKGLKRDARGEEVLRVLRLALAEEVARVWMEGTEED
ncbi:hypothetical protein EJ06DRAFT_491714 [Trichodelitschia bisporula]|uniref:Nuclear pore complex protein Nup85 n=1 Tax=Trichodelitschia bisporula TaxID=703511 RepID=A0A6G1I180_9PEZI|nr:hypothetical protein EJ06DRAFT_491714 [Trichodelitschia bisporula]